MAISTREELINALREACTIEHGLMVQYLYTALTMKRSPSDGLNNAQQVLARKWQADILRVAEDEMFHLAMVCHVLAAIGGVPKFHRPNMPQDQDYYPFKFDLIPFSDLALYRFMVFELPRGEDLPPPPLTDSKTFRTLTIHDEVVPDPLEWDYVGELYQQISDGLKKIPEKELFIRPNSTGPGEWGRGSVNFPIEGIRAAEAGIKWIIEQGEGSPANTSNSHYKVFESMRANYQMAGMFEIDKNVPMNPATRKHREADGTIALIKNKESRKAVETFNGAYGLMLYMIQFQFSLLPNQYKNNALENEKLRSLLRESCKHIMSTTIRPMAEIVCELPFDEESDAARVGPSFEIYSDIALSQDPEVNLTIMMEKFAALIEAINELGKRIPRALSVADTLRLIERNIKIGKIGVTS